MMKSVLLFFVATGVAVVTATNMQSSMDHAAIFASRSRVARQSECSATEQLGYFADVDSSCYLDAIGLDFEKLVQLDPEAIASFSEIFCRPECGNPLLRYTRDCVINGTFLQVLYTQYCATNSMGIPCYSSDVTTALVDTARVCFEAVRDDTNALDLCCTEIRSTIDIVGCCINILDGGGQFQIVGPVLNIACGVDVPGICTESTISIDATDGSLALIASTLGILTGALAMLATIALQSLF